MKIIFTKHHNCVQLIHIHEHLAISSIYDHLYSLGYFEFIDYTIKGDTFYNGTCIVEFETANSTVFKLFLERINKPLRAEKNQIQNAMTEVEAERQVPLEYSTWSKVSESLKELSDKHWLKLGQHGIHENSDILQSPITISRDRKFPKTNEVIVEIELPEVFSMSHIELLPLYRLLSQAIAWNIGTRLGENYSIYNHSVSYEGAYNDRQGVEIIWKVSPDFKLVADDMIADIQETVRYMHKQDAFLRMCRWLSSFDYTDETNAYPDIFETYRTSHSVPTYEQWRSVATIENCILLSSKMRISLKYDNFTQQA